jgi:hypothetical protein
MATAKKIFEWLFYLVDNTITTNDDTDRIAKVKTRKTKGIEDIAARIVQDRTEYRKETIMNIMALANAAKLEFLSQGEMVNDGLVLFEPTITGVFYDNAEFDPRRHRCVVNTRVSGDVQAMLKQVKGVYNGLTLDNGGAAITGVADTVTGATNGEVTSGKTITITGNKIRVVPEEGETAASCITYTNLETKEVIAQEDTPVINDPSKLVLQLPQLGVGSYALTIKTLFSSGQVALKAPRYITAKLKLVVRGEAGAGGHARYQRPEQAGAAASAARRRELHAHH